MKHYDIAVIGGDGTGPEVVREAVKVLDAAARKFGFKLNYVPLRFRRRPLPAHRRGAARQRRRRAAQVPGDSPRRHRPSRREAGHPREGHPAAPALRAGAVHQPAPGEALRRRASARSRTRARRTSTSSSCARTTKASTPAPAASCSRARRTRSPSRRASTRAAASSAACATPSSSPASATSDKKLTLCGKTNVLTYAFDLWERAFHEIGAEGLPRHQARLRPRRRHHACGSSRTPSGST